MTTFTPEIDLDGPEFGRIQALVDERIADVLAQFNAEGVGAGLATFKTLGEAMGALEPLRYLIKDFWVLGSYGMVAGPEKSYKSFLSLSIALAVASGKPLFGKFEVLSPGPVVIFTGEGSTALAARRLVRLGAAFGLTATEVAALPIHLTSWTAPASSTEFGQVLAYKIAETGACLVIVDPFYAYHGPSQHGGGNVYEEGVILSAMSDVTTAAGVSLLVVHHFNKAASTGGKLSLTGITMAGGREWVDSWVLVAKREEPDFETGIVRLHAEIGTRQDEIGHDLDIDLQLDRRVGPGEYEGAMSWDVRPHVSEGKGQSDGDISQTIADIVRDHPGELTKTEIVKAVGGTASKVREVFEACAATAVIRPVKAEYIDKTGRTRHHECWIPRQVSDREPRF